MKDVSGKTSRFSWELKEARVLRPCTAVRICPTVGLDIKIPISVLTDIRDAFIICERFY